MAILDPEATTVMPIEAVCSAVNTAALIYDEIRILHFLKRLRLPLGSDQGK